VPDVQPYSILPFILLLLSIAIVPFINRNWWEGNFGYFPFGLAAVTSLFYLFANGTLSRIFEALNDYFSFIILIASLFIVSGGILIKLKGKANPVANTITLLVGAIVSNMIGTTGASMILIRPFIRVNKNRLKPYHLIFFIFLVSNIGGALTPIGDPPLFLGYLMGVPFFWVFANVWYVWLFALTVLLLLFFVIDFLSLKKIEHDIPGNAQDGFHEETQILGLHNMVFLGIILAAVFIQEPKYVRELLMIVAAAGSYMTTKKSIHKENHFTFHPINEVAILFLGIFITMAPALDWLELHAASIGLHTAGQYYWTTGGLSSVLDNAPAYLNFLHAAIGLNLSPDTLTQLQNIIAAKGTVAGTFTPEIQRTIELLAKNHPVLMSAGSIPATEIRIAYMIANHSMFLIAISLGAVFFGAMTYIGNGPNFMVKSIAEESGLKCPSFFEYIIKYSIPILMPLFLIVWWLFLR
jgi:Na+/H+ antiporter NhaD/arsenite permease-like protein